LRLCDKWLNNTTSYIREVNETVKSICAKITAVINPNISTTDMDEILKNSTVKKDILKNYKKHL
jgi:hypothetical protein